MHNLVKRVLDSYDRSSILRFLISYFFVLLIPLCIAFAGFELTFKYVQEDIRMADQNMLDHTRTVLDQELDSIRMFALQIVYNEKLQGISDIEKADADFILNAQSALNEIFSLPLSTGISLMDSFYVSIFKPEYILSGSSLYRTDSFVSYIKNRGMTVEEWKSMCFHDNLRAPYFYSSDNNIQYVFPYSTSLEGDNKGAVVCNISSYELNKILDFKKEYGKYSLFIFDKNSSLLWSDDALGVGHNINAFENKPGYVGLKSASTKYGLKYLVVVPEYVALKRLYALKTTIILIILFASLLGIILSITMSVRFGKPLNFLFDAVEKNKGSDIPVSHTIQNLVQLFEDMEAVNGKNELFYPDLIEDNLILSIRAGNKLDTESLINLIENENCINRSLSDDMFALLHGNLIALLREFTSDIPDHLSDITDVSSCSLFFYNYKSFCLDLCEQLWQKKSKNRKELADKIKKYVEENYSDSSLSLSLFSNMFNVSESYLSTVFKEQTSSNFQSFLEGVRLQHACSLLSETDYPVEDISVKSGYYTVQSFRRAFKKNMGISPSDFRARKEWNK